MKRFRAKYFVALLTLMLLAAGASSADSGYPEALRAHWKRISDMFIQIVGAMPEDKLTFARRKDIAAFANW